MSSVRIPPRLPLVLLKDRLAVARLPATAAAPSWADSPGTLSAVVRTPDELSILLDEAHVPTDVRAERGYRALKVRGPLTFDLIGILAAMAQPLADDGISIFAQSTFDTDYLLVKESDLARALEVLSSAGHEVSTSDALPGASR